MREEFAAYLHHLAVEKNSSAHTVKSYREDLEQAIGFFTKQLGGDTAGVGQISTRLVRSWLAWLHDQKYAKSTIARRLAAVRSWLRHLCRIGRLKANPADGIRGPKREKHLPQVLTETAVVQLCEAPDAASWFGLRDKAIFETIYSAGLRVSEASGLNVEDIDLDDGVAVVRGKGKKERLALLGKPAVSALKTWLKERATLTGGKQWNCPAAFLNKNGTRLTTRSMGRLMAKYLQQQGLDSRASPHTLRHSFATHMLDHGAEIRGVQELLGHEQLSTTQIYTHLSTTKLQDTYQQAHPRAS
jgi:integrase/recombinase XerC